MAIFKIIHKIYEKVLFGFFSLLERGVHDFRGLLYRDLGIERTVTSEGEKWQLWTWCPFSEHAAGQTHFIQLTQHPYSKPCRLSSMRSRYAIFPSIILNKPTQQNRCQKNPRSNEEDLKRLDCSKSEQAASWLRFFLPVSPKMEFSVELAGPQILSAVRLSIFTGTAVQDVGCWTEPSV